MRNHLTNLKGLAQKMDAAGLDISLPSLHWSDTLQRSARCRVNSNRFLPASLGTFFSLIRQSLNHLKYPPRTAPYRFFR